jgi:hypothetical protein
MFLAVAAGKSKKKKEQKEGKAELQKAMNSWFTWRRGLAKRNWGQNVVLSPDTFIVTSYG